MQRITGDHAKHAYIRARAASAARAAAVVVWGPEGRSSSRCTPPHTCNGKECLVCDSALNEDEGDREYEHLKVMVFSTYLTKLFTNT